MRYKLRWSVFAVPIAALAVLGCLYAPAAGAAVRFKPVPGASEYPGAVEPGALQFACSSSLDELGAHFSSVNLPFEPRLARKGKDGYCHVFYRPSIPGFRAHPDNAPLIGIRFDVDGLSFYGKREKLVGDSLDIAKEIVRFVGGDLDIAVQVSGVAGGGLLTDAVRHHFGGSSGSVRIRPGAGDVTSSWVQDYMKSGAVNGQTVVLTPRKLWEGRPEYGNIFGSTLDALEEEGFIRSRLSWDGGDLQFIIRPGAGDRVILVHGDAAKEYWAAALTDAEYAWVLRVEFGAEESIDLSGIMPHVDYAVCFLPEANAVLVAEPVRQRHDIARQALDILTSVYGPELPAELEKLREAMRYAPASSEEGGDRVRHALRRARKNCGQWTIAVPTSRLSALNSYTERNCPEDIRGCFEADGRLRLLTASPALLRAGLDMALDVFDGTHVAPRMLSVIESQLPGYRSDADAILADGAQKLKRLGFRVVRVPWLGGPTELDLKWAGLSYANSAVVRRTLFVPQFGFGGMETELLRRLRAAFDGEYQIAPVFARHAMLRNGGTHCVLGTIREQPRIPGVPAPSIAGE